MLKVDASDAPEGFFATAMVDECVGCCFFSDRPCTTNYPCMREEREDMCDVIFRLKEVLMPKIDQNEAPYGYVAVIPEDNECSGCAFNQGSPVELDCKYLKHPCGCNDRMDGCEVIFRARETADVSIRERRRRNG